MAATLWLGSIIPWTDLNGDPYVGAKVYFYDESTDTPQTVYTDSSLSTAAGISLRTANARGQFLPLFLSPGSYRHRVLAADNTVISDVDGIAVAQTSDYVPPSAGETSTELLFQTGDYKLRHATGSHAGWVRSNGRTIGSASSGATERANADCEDLFLHLWTADVNLSVSGGRGATASTDWAANKTIALPDWRGRAPAGLDDMGNTAAGQITDFTTLGETTGSQTHTLETTEIPAHPHTGTTDSSGEHGHPTRVSITNEGLQKVQGGIMLRDLNVANYDAHDSVTPDNAPGNQIGMAGDHEHTFTTDAAGGGGAHNNLQPTIAVTVYIKL